MKSKIIAFIITFFIFHQMVNASIFDESMGARSAALGFTSITTVDLWSSINNQAGLAYIDKLSIGAYTENKFLMSSLCTKSIAIVLPFSHGSLGISLVQFGESNFNETKIGLSYGMRLGKQISAGIQIFQYSINQIQELGRANLFSFQGGLVYIFDNTFKIGFHFFNPEFITKSENKLEIPGIFKIGLSYHLSQTLQGFLEIENHSKFGSGILTGIEYLNSKNIAFRIGYNSLSEKLTFGLGFKLKNLIIDLASNMHQTLGYSPQISLIYEF